MKKTILDIHKEALPYLRKKDPILGTIIAVVAMPQWNFERNYFLHLVDTIISQQLSEKAGTTIFNRFKDLFDTDTIHASDVVIIPDQKLRDAGMSWSKVRYIKNVALWVEKNNMVLEKLHELPDEEVITELTRIKGIGRWTAEMFLIFSLHRADVFSYGDGGLRTAIKKLYGFANIPTKEEADCIAAVWKPYRSIASLYLWKSLELESL